MTASLVGNSALTTSAQAAAAPPSDESSLRIGVLALAGAISAVGQTGELATPLPFTSTSLADVLELDERLTSDLAAALAGEDLEDALDELDGVEIVDDADPNRIAFTYTRTVANHPLALVHDDGDLRFDANDGAGNLDVSLVTRPSDPFVIAIDPNEPDPLLRVALVSQPVLDLSVDIETDDLDGFGARQGFTEIDVTGGHYRVHRDQVITMRDPDGRGVLTLEDLRYSTLPDLFRIQTPADEIDVELDVALPDSLSGGTAGERTGSMTLTEDDTPADAAWPTAADATRVYGAALAEATGLTMVDGLSSLAQYTGTVLALQDAADVPFPNLGGGTTDVFAPGDLLLDLLSTAAAAQVRCGAAPEFPPSGVAAPGDTVYCMATTAEGLGDITDVTWSTNGDGSVVSPSDVQDAAIGSAPSDVVQIDGSDGEPDAIVTFTAGGQEFTARTMPSTVQEVTRRIEELGDSEAGASLNDGRLDVSVDLAQSTASASLKIGNSDTLGALVGLTGLGSDSDEAGQAEATAEATDANFDVGFGIQTGALDEGESRQTWLLPSDASLLRIGGLSASDVATGVALPARIGFLGVTATLTELSLGSTAGDPAVVLERAAGTGPLLISDLLNADGALQPGTLNLDSNVTAGIAFSATERPLTVGGSEYPSGANGPASGSASVAWGPAGLPQVTFGDGYQDLRAFDPVPATFLSGTAQVTAGAGGAADTVKVDVTLPAGITTLHEALGVAEPGTGDPDVEVARRLLTAGLACQNVTLDDVDTLTCEGFAPNGEAALDQGEDVELIVLGDPFALRDSVLEGLSATLGSFDGLTGDNISNALVDDQYTSTLPLVDLTPAQLALEREALAQGLGRMVKAAAEDEAGGTGGLPSVSSAQELSAAVDALVKVNGSGALYQPSLEFTLGDELGIALEARAPVGASLQAPLRFNVNGPGQVSSDAGFAVGVESTTVLAIDVDTDTARPSVSDDTGTISTARVALGATPLNNKHLQAGVGDLTVTGAGSSANLGVTVSTDYVLPASGAGELETTRTNARPSGKAAVADLVVGAATPLHFEADATDSSGGLGAAQPAPEAMQVKYAAEGLDGLATALGQAMDGAAPRNIGPGGAPISAPLIGTNLDAGADVPGTLTGLTSDLRDELEGIDADNKAELESALKTAVKSAVDGAVGLEDIAPADVSVLVTCGGENSACVPCPEPEEGEEAPVCLTEGPTGWETVSISLELEGSPRSGQTQFETGLAGLEVRSDAMIDTSTSWTLPVTLELARGVGPRVVIKADDALEVDVQATIPTGMQAIVGYLPADITAAGAHGSVHTVVNIAPAVGTYDLFDLYDGELVAVPGFADPSGHTEDGIKLDFETVAGDAGAFDLLGNIDVPWSAADGFGEITYNDVKLDVGEVAAAIATPFAVVDPYLAPVRDVMDVLRTPLPVISDLSELAGGEQITLLYLLETLSKATKKPQVELAHRVIGLVDGVATAVGAIATIAKEKVPLSDLAGLGALLTLDPSDVDVYEKCTQRVASTPLPTTGPTTTPPKKTEPCPDDDELADQKAGDGVAGQTTNANRTGERKAMSKNLTQKTKSVTGSVPGFSLPFLAEPDQLMDVLTGEGEASYFRLDFGTLAATVAYSRKFGPIMAGPVPIVPFVGGSISVEGRLAMGFDSHAQTLAVENLAHPGDVSGLLDAYGHFDGGDIIREGFYVDDLDSDGVDVPEVKLVTTLEAGAGVSIGIVTAGLKGGVTLTINLDINDPDDDGKLRMAEIRDRFQGDASCIFDASAGIEAFISVFIEIELLFTSLEYEFDLLRLGPYELFNYGCPDVVPTLVKQGTGDTLVLTSGAQSSQRMPNATDVADEYEVRQFDEADGAEHGGTTTYEVSAFGRVQRVLVEPSGAQFSVTVYGSGITTSTDNPTTFTAATLPRFVADGGQSDDKLSFLTGETFTLADDGEMTLTATSFSSRVTSLTGGVGDDALVTGDGNDVVDGGSGNDSIETGAGDDTASGGADNDVIGGGVGRDDLFGGSGSDRLEGGPGADRANGGDDPDSLVGGPGRDVRAVLVLPTGQDEDADNDGAFDIVEEQVRVGFDSGDVLVGGKGADQVDGGDGSDVVVGGEESTLTSTLPGAMAALFGTGEREVNVLIPGNTNPGQQTVEVDTAKVPGPAALDALCESGTAQSGAANTDFVTGGAELDVVVGGNGPDRLDGGAGPDEICGRAGDDQLSGDGAEDDEDSNDIIRGGHGNDRADGGPGADLMLGDDVSLFRSGQRVLDGSLGSAADGNGADYLEGGDGTDVLAGGDGSDLLLGGLGDDSSYGEGQDTTESGGTAPPVSDRLLDCNTTTRVVAGLVDLNGDLLAGNTDAGVTPDDGRLAGLQVDDGTVLTMGSTSHFQGLLGADIVVIDGLVDLDRDGSIDRSDTGMIPMASMLGTTSSNSAGDCLLSGDGNDDLRGGKGSDYLGAGDGTDLALGGDGNDLVLGDGGVDVVLGGPHHDVLVGGLGDDYLGGGNGDDRLHGNEGADDLVGGSDQSGAGDGQDVLLGGRETDILAAENAALVSDTIVDAVTETSVPWQDEAIVPASVKAGATSNLRYTNNALICDDVELDRWATLLVGDGLAGTPVKSPGAPLAYDELYGGFGCDWVFGSTGNDLVRGGQDDDIVEAGPGADIAQGDDGDDVVIGGSTVNPAVNTRITKDRSGAGVADGGDLALLGDGGADHDDGSDLIAGDNALPKWLPQAVAAPSATYILPVWLPSATGVVGPHYTLQLNDLTAFAGGPVNPALAGADTIDGGGFVDRLFGQGGNDIVSTGTGNDYAEGNAGADTLDGAGGDDDLIGGSSTNDGLPLGANGLRLDDNLPATPYDGSAVGPLDAADTINGGDGADYVLGDNGRITRPAGARDIATTDEIDASIPQTSGGDTITGGANDDRLFGNDGTDTIDAGADTDHVEGNSGNDRALGGAGDDTVIGGSSVSPDGRGTIGQLPVVVMADGDDVLFGDEQATAAVGRDFVFGDNATVLKLASGLTVTQLADTPLAAAAAAGTSGNDTIDGGGAADAVTGASDGIFGQGGNDVVTSGSARDYIEGNSGADRITSGAGDDDVIGGTSANDGRPLGLNGLRLAERVTPGIDTSAARVYDDNDEVHAGRGLDTVLGDNGRITRPTDGNQPVPDVAMADTTNALTYGSDKLYGDDDHDVLYGQLDDGVALSTGDLVDGGAGNDALIGDLAVVKRTPAEQLSSPQSLTALPGPPDFISEPVYRPGTIIPETVVPSGQVLNGGPDVGVGGPGDDVLHLGAGNDLANGDAGNDVVFGGDGNDALWGGLNHDQLFGGFGADDLDLKLRTGDPASYAPVRGTEDEDANQTTTNGNDFIYGGWGPDELQADVIGPARSFESDYIIDWVEDHNLYYFCAPPSGGRTGPPPPSTDYRIIKASTVGLRDLMVGLARAAGARDANVKNSAGWYDVGLVIPADETNNIRTGPEYPGKFGCG